MSDRAALLTGIGGASRLRPSHTTVRTVPYTAVRRVKQPWRQTGKTEFVKVGIGEREVNGLGGAGAPSPGRTAAERYQPLGHSPFAQFLVTPLWVLELSPAVTA